MAASGRLVAYLALDPDGNESAATSRYETRHAPDVPRTFCIRTFVRVDAPASKRISWADRPLNELIRLSWPIAISMLSYTAMTLVDTLFVGHLGGGALAGVGLGGTLAFSLACFAIGFLRSQKVLISQEIGAGNRGAAVSILGAGLWMSLALAAVFTVIGLVGSPLVGTLGGGGAAGEEAIRYFTIRTLGLSLLLPTTALREARYGIGDTRSPMRAAVIANVANVAFNALFLFGFEWGVAGSAWATNLATVVEGAVLVVAQRSSGFGLAKARAWLKPLWHIGWPTGLQTTLEVGSWALLAALIAHMGENQIAGHHIAWNILQVAFLPTFALAEAASVLTGQAVGAGNLQLVRTIAHKGLLVAIGWAVGCGALLALGGNRIVAFFTQEPELAAVSWMLLLIGAVFQLFDAANMMARAVLRGTGDVKVPAAIVIGSAWVATPPLTWLLGMKMGWGAAGGWAGLAAEIFVGALILWWRLEKGQWLGPLRATAQLRPSKPKVAPEPVGAQPALA